MARYGKIYVFCFFIRFSLVLTIFHSGGATGLWAIVLWSFEIFLIFSNLLRSFVLMPTSQATHINQFITNNHASFHLWWNKNLLNHQTISQYDEHDCLQKFLLLFMSLLTAFIVQNSHILPGIYLIFLNSVLRPTWKALTANFGPPLKDRERIYQARQSLALFCKLVILVLG